MVSKVAYLRLLMKEASLFLLVIVIGCRDQKAIRIEGETMATTYHITYFHHQNFKKEIDSLLILVNKEINNYDPTSEISVFNKSKIGARFSFAAPLDTPKEADRKSTRLNSSHGH